MTSEAGEQEPDVSGKVTEPDAGHAASNPPDPSADAAAAPSEPGRIPRRPLAYAGAVMGALLCWGAWVHYENYADAKQTQAQTKDYVPHVRVAMAKREDGPVRYTIPGTISAFDSSTIYARATGYIAERRVDIGSRVRAGDLLVRISAPDLDQQVAQANAQLLQMEAALLQANAEARQAASNVRLGTVTNFRTSTLATEGWSTRQDADNTRLGLQGSQASLQAAQANVKMSQASLVAQFADLKRLQRLQAYEDVTAPFDGVITSRSVDAGDLVSADNNGASNTMFTIVRDDVLRVQIDVPQSGAIAIRDGLEAKVSVQELPNRVFTGRVNRSAAALVQASRTMQSEVDVSNKDGILRPGLYVTVDIGVPRTAPAVLIPAEAILFNGKGLRVAVVGQDGVVHMHAVNVYRDFGTSIELRSGLSGGESVIITPPANMDDGDKVSITKDNP